MRYSKTIEAISEGPEISHALMVQHKLGRVSSLELMDSSVFDMNSTLTETTSAQKNERRTDSNYQLRKIEE